MDEPLPETLAELLPSVHAWVARRRAPTRHQVRAVFVALGEVLLAGNEADEPEAFAQVAAWIERDPAGWNEAFAAELAMAATEHVRSADSRWLGNPKYDLAYTVEARHRLEARLACAERFGVEIADELLEAIARADAVLAPYLERAADGTDPG